MLYEDAEAAIAHLAREGVPPERIALWGWSLGSGVAAEMAKRGHGARLVLLAPFTSVSVVEMAKRMVPFLPVSLLMSRRRRSRRPALPASRGTPHAAALFDLLARHLSDEARE